MKDAFVCKGEVGGIAYSCNEKATEFVEGDLEKLSEMGLYRCLDISSEITRYYVRTGSFSMCQKEAERILSERFEQCRK